MGFDDFLLLADAIFRTIKPGFLSEETLVKLSAIFPHSLVIAALDIIDRKNAIQYTTPWGHTEYEVIGSTAKYSVLLDIKASPIPYSCSCCTFVYSVLVSGTHIICKHILASILAREMHASTRRINVDDLAAILIRQFLSDKLVEQKKSILQERFESGGVQKL